MISGVSLENQKIRPDFRRKAKGGGNFPEG
jgi:hypothetical protein